MMRARLSNILRQRRLVRKLARRSAHRNRKTAWLYRDHLCTVTFNFASGVYLGGIAGLDGRVLSSRSIEELQNELQHVVDCSIGPDVENRDV